MESSAASVRPRTVAFPLFDRLGPTGVWLLGFLFVVSVAGSAGGYRPTTWAWISLLSWWAAVIAIIVKRQFSIGSLDLIMIGGIVAFTGWFALSALWSQSAPSTLDMSTRYVAYAGLVTAALLLVERGTVVHLVGGVTAGIWGIALYALGTRILPDRLGEFSSTAAGYRLSAPISYWNGLGVFCSMGILLALGFALRGERLVTRTLAGAALPVLACAMYFTFSRGAWIGLLVGLAAAILLDPHRLQLAFGTALLGAGFATAILMASRLDGLTTPGSTLAQATHDGHRLVLPLVGLSAVTAATALVLGILERRIAVPGSLRLAWAAVLVAALAIAVGAVWAQHGSPVHLAQRAWNEAHAPVKVNAGTNTGRLFDLSSNGRFDLWHVAWDTFRADPITGTGGGTFWQVWAASPRQSLSTVDPHSAYFGALSDLGIVGLALLLAALIPPVVAAIRSRHSPLIPFVLAAYAAWAAHSGIDWDWTLTGVTGAALLCGVALVASARQTSRELRPWLRTAAAAAAAALALLSITAVVHEQRLAAASDSLGRGEYARAADQARSARTFAPWSVAALDLIAEAQQSLGQKDAALATRRRIVQRDPESWSAWLNLAVAASGAERRAASAEAIRLNPLAPRL